MLVTRKGVFFCFIVLLHTAHTFISVNLALNKPVSQSSDYLQYFAEKAVDGVTSGIFQDDSCSHTNHLNSLIEWWEVDLGSTYDVTDIIIYNRVDCCGSRLNKFVIQGGVDCSAPDLRCFTDCYNQTEAIETSERISCNYCNARYIRVKLDHDEELTLCEVEIYGLPANSTPGTHTCSKYIPESSSSIEPSPTTYLAFSSSFEFTSSSSVDYMTTQMPYVTTWAPSETTTNATMFQTVTNDYCSCTCRLIDDDPKVIEEKLTEIKANLTVDTIKLSSSRRKKTSAVDQRPSATSVGYMGVIVLAIVMGLLVLQDTLTAIWFIFSKIKMTVSKLSSVHPTRINVKPKGDMSVPIHMITTNIGSPPNDSRFPSSVD